VKVSELKNQNNLKRMVLMIGYPATSAILSAAITQERNNKERKKLEDNQDWLKKYVRDQID